MPDADGGCDWCSTKVTAEGEYLIGFWGCCNEQCKNEYDKGN